MQISPYTNILAGIPYEYSSSNNDFWIISQDRAGNCDLNNYGVEIQYNGGVNINLIFLLFYFYRP